MPNPKTGDGERHERAQRLRELRESTGMDRDVFAGRLGISYVTLRNAENGYQAIGRRTLAAAEKLVEEIRGGPGVPASQALCPRDGIHIDDQQLVDIVRSCRDKAVLTAAEGVASAVGISLDEAIAMLVRKRLDLGP